ncbi:Dihydroceramide fatty acyl 2-hydroxylase FAH1, partial [Glycine soja]
YKLEIKVEDKNNANFIFWDDQCFKFIEKSVADQIQLMKDEGEDDLKVYLDPLDKMLECTLAMRIRMQPKGTSEAVNTLADVNQASQCDSTQSLSATADHDPYMMLNVTPAKRLSSESLCDGLLCITLFNKDLKAHQNCKMVVQNFVVDLNKALVFQVGHLGGAYEEWVHQPIVSNEGPRFFENEILEFLTRTVWWAIPVIWLPVVCWFIHNSVQMGLSCPHLALLVVLGIFVWTLLEYSLHRFLFHIKTKTYWGNTLHYLLHGCHHKHPMDGLRLVFPPAATAILLMPFWNLVKLMATPSTAPALFGGGLLGYVMYDCTHYYLHHGQPKTEVPRNLKKYHLNHHFRIQDKGFGITSSLWDKVFGTLPPKMDAKSM